MSRTEATRQPSLGTPERSSTSLAVPVTPQENHIMWLDCQEAYLAWADILSTFTLTLAFLDVSAWLILAGHDIGGMILGTVDLVALTTVFVTRRTMMSPSRDSTS